MSPPSRTAALVVLCAGLLMIILDGSIVTVALPAIQRDLGFSPSGLTWTVNAYMIAFGGLLLLAGRLGDLVGRRRMFVAGLLVFTAASLLCGVSTGPAMLIAARFVQGVGGAMASSVSLGMIVTHFPEPRERGRAIGAYGFVGAAGASIGAFAGGVLTQAVSWHWIFFVNLPIGVAATLGAVRVLEPDRGLGLRAGADVPGAVLVTAGLMLGVYAIVETGRYGWGSARTLGVAAVAVALLAGFVARQARAARPLLPLGVLRSRAVAGANAVQLLMVASLFGFQVLIALYLQDVRGYGAAATGAAMLPAALSIAVVSLGLSARVNARFGERRALLAGIALLVAAIGLLTRLPVHAGYAVDLLPTLLLASGFGLAISALTALGMSGAGERDAGVVSGLFNTSQQAGAALGVAVLSTFAAARTRTLTAAGHDRASALTGGFHLAFAIGTGLLATAFVLAAVVLRPAARPAPDRTPEETPVVSPSA
jgi:EmrB/QacA subfamily drug resistance transporter